jgi:hypothetical protein
MDIREVRGQVRHVKVARHSGVNRSVVLRAMPLWDQPNLLNALRPCARVKDRLNSHFYSHKLKIPRR